MSRRRPIAAVLGALGAGVAVWGGWLAVVVPGNAGSGEGFDPGFVRGTGIFMLCAGVLVVVLAGIAWRRRV